MIKIGKITLENVLIIVVTAKLLVLPGYVELGALAALFGYSALVSWLTTKRVSELDALKARISRLEASRAFGS